MLRLPTPRAYLTYMAHLFKAVFRQHHTELRPALAHYINADAVIVDVGAHAGQFTKLFAAMAPQGLVYSFEPGAYALSILRKVKLTNGLHNVSIVPFGLGDAPGEAVLHLPIKKSGSIGFGLGSLTGPRQGSRTYADKVSITTLDAFVEANKITRLDFIKCDIEGWELHMLKGAQKTLERLSPVLMVEVNHDALQKAGASKQAMDDFLQALGYREISHVEKDAIFAKTNRAGG